MKIDLIALLIKELWGEMYLHNEDPMTCPKCGCRTMMLFDISHIEEYGEIHRCLDRRCQKTIIATGDIDE